MYIVRFSNHINSDIKRNWSSWSFGQEGFEGTEEELQEAIQETIDNDGEFYISGFDICGSKLKNADIRELYQNYWVLVDPSFENGLACNTLDAETLEEAIQEVSAPDFDIEYGKGQCVNCSNAKVVYSFDWKGNQTHILEVEGLVY